MKKIFSIFIVFLFGVSLLCFYSCTKDKPSPVKSTLDAKTTYLTSGPWVYNKREVKLQDSSWMSIPLPVGLTTVKITYNLNHSFILTSGTAATKLDTSRGTWQLADNGSTLQTTFLNSGTSSMHISILNASTLQIPLVEANTPIYPYADPVTKNITFYYGVRFTYTHP